MVYAWLIFGILFLDQFHFFWGRIIGLNFFIDEYINLLAADHFFKTFDYSAPGYLAEPFDPTISSGLLSTFPAAVGWEIGRTIFLSRIFTVIYVVFFAHLFLYLAFRKLKYSSALSLVLAALTWLISQKIPWSYGYIHNLGEIQGALWVLLGVILLKDHPYFSSLSFGIAVWYAKLLYLPIAGGFLLCGLFTRKDKSLKNISEHGLIFLSPILLWVVIIALRFDSHTLLSWLGRFTHYYSANQGGLATVPRSAHLLDRLRDPQLPWLESQEKGRILLLLFLPMAIALFQILKSRSPKLWPFHLNVFICLMAFSLWFFFWHPLMWIRHIQPALLLGYGYLLFCILQKVHPILKKEISQIDLKIRGQTRRVVVVLLTLIFIFKGVDYFHGAYRDYKTDQQTSYAFVCRDSLDNSACKKLK